MLLRNGVVLRGSYGVAFWMNGASQELCTVGACGPTAWPDDEALFTMSSVGYAFDP